MLFNLTLQSSTLSGRAVPWVLLFKPLLIWTGAGPGQMNYQNARCRGGSWMQVFHVPFHINALSNKVWTAKVNSFKQRGCPEHSSRCYFQSNQVVTAKRWYKSKGGTCNQLQKNNNTQPETSRPNPIKSRLPSSGLEHICLPCQFCPPRKDSGWGPGQYHLRC